MSSFYTEKVFTPKFLEKNVGLEKMVKSSPGTERTERNFHPRRKSIERREPVRRETPVNSSRAISVSSLDRLANANGNTPGE